tara:strand:+ start:227 stop:910 length:684 start_codon:yes stop_codon:yes gene_type:complete
MKIKHYSIFNELSEPKIDWNNLRENKNESQYFIPNNIDDYNLISDNEDYKKITERTINFIEENNIERIFSIGSGRAIFEYKLKIKTMLHTTISDITNSIFKIKKFNIFDEVLLIDITERLNLSIYPNTLMILPRIDTELSDQQMHDLFKQLNNKKVKYLLFIPAQLLTIRSLLIQLYIYLKSIITNKRLVDCGYSRNKYRFIKLWKKYYSIESSYKFKYVFLKNHNL